MFTLSQHRQRREDLEQQWYLASMLMNIPGVIPKDELLAKDERVGSKMHKCEDETTPTGVVKFEQKDGASCSGGL